MEDLYWCAIEAPLVLAFFNDLFYTVQTMGALVLIALIASWGVSFLAVSRVKKADHLFYVAVGSYVLFAILSCVLFSKTGYFFNFIKYIFPYAALAGLVPMVFLARYYADKISKPSKLVHTLQWVLVAVGAAAFSLPIAIMAIDYATSDVQQIPMTYQECVENGGTPGEPASFEEAF